MWLRALVATYILTYVISIYAMSEHQTFAYGLDHYHPPYCIYGLSNMCDNNIFKGLVHWLYLGLLALTSQIIVSDLMHALCIMHENLPLPIKYAI